MTSFQRIPFAAFRLARILVQCNITIGPLSVTASMPNDAFVPLKFACLAAAKIHVMVFKPTALNSGNGGAVDQVVLDTDGLPTTE